MSISWTILLYDSVVCVWGGGGVGVCVLTSVFSNKNSLGEVGGGAAFDRVSLYS